MKEKKPFLTIKWNGTNFPVSKEEAIILAQKGYDYTQKTQKLCEERKDFIEQLGSLHFSLEKSRVENKSLLRRINSLKGVITKLKKGGSHA